MRRIRKAAMPARALPWQSITACAAVLVAGCIGNIGTPDEGSLSPKPGEGEQPVCVGGAAGPAPMRRLTREEYNKTIFDLLGDSSNLASAFALDASVGVFKNNTNSPVTALLATQYMEAADALATTAMGSLDALLPCDPAAPGDESACLVGFLESFGARAYRRPLADAEIARYDALFTKVRGELAYGFGDAIRVVLTTMLQSPMFLYHVEGVTAPSTDPVVAIEAVNGFELASRLSYFLWGTMPDDALLDAAGSGALDTPEGVEKEVLRMLEHEYAREGLRKLYGQWLSLDKLASITKDPTVYDGFDATVAGVLQAETETFVDDVLWGEDARLEMLLTASYSFLDETLAGIYGVDGVSGSELVHTELDPTQRAGILTHASILATNAHAYQTSPVFRGKFVRERLLCQTLPSPPGDVDVSALEPDPTLTTRERFALHQTDPYCRSCHELMDPIGLGMERYDPVGRFRMDENGLAIDDSGEIIKSDDVNGPFNGAVELAQRLAGSEQVTACVTKQFVSYAIGRSPTEEDLCSVETLAEGKTPSELDLRELIVAITKTDAFRKRKAADVEVCQ